MCGIAGSRSGGQGVIAGMLDRIAHRGPDGRGIDGIHGHVRLAMLDPSEGSAQPFSYRGGVLAYNGELWNHNSLRDELRAQGHSFRTTGDTEVLAAALYEWGLGALDKLDGMFAFAWTDPFGRTMLVRDAFGKVPLYFCERDGDLRWASERKAFPRGWQPVAVPPGEWLDVNSGRLSQWYYRAYNPEPDLPPERLLGLLREGVRKRLEADRPVCVLVSGGLDSALILALAKEVSDDVTAFTAYYDENSADLRAATRLCRDLNVPLYDVPIEVTEERISRAMYAIEMNSIAQIEIAVACLPLAEAIYREGFRACLSGEAADELFGGYGSFKRRAWKQPTSTVIGLRLAALEKMSRGNFMRCNKAFMAAGVECRLPFMEQELVEEAVWLDLEASPPPKKLLKQAARSVLPAWVITRQKETFQGGAGISTAIRRFIASPSRYYNNELRKAFGYLPTC